MKYPSNNQHSHAEPNRIGVLLTNLGTPGAPTKSALKVYLKEFLSDPRVVEVPRLVWWFILNFIILQVRPARSAKSYSSVWTDEGSPLMSITRAQQKKISSRLGDQIIVECAMRYGQPSISDVLQKMFNQKVRKLLVLPLYPQYCAATSASTFDALAKEMTATRWLPDIRFVSHYHDHPDYITACVKQIENYWAEHGRAEKLILSYHGVPERYLHSGDPYFCECHKTTRLITAQLGLDENQYQQTFQSRFGREEWLKPYTDATLKALPGLGITSVQVFCPGFSADCLETLEEIDVENRQYFLAAGGESFEYIPALNTSEQHIDALINIIQENINGWSIDNSERTMQKLLAFNLGAKQ